MNLIFNVMFDPLNIAHEDMLQSAAISSSLTSTVRRCIYPEASLRSLSPHPD